MRMQQAAETLTLDPARANRQRVLYLASKACGGRLATSHSQQPDSQTKLASQRF